MLLAKARGELVEKRLVELQASFLLLAMSRQALALPQALCDRLAAVNGPLEVKAILNEAMLGLLAEIIADHGPVLFHQSGGCCDGSSPMCYPRGDFLIGDRDVLLGVIGEDTPVYISASQYETWKHTDLVIDVVPGRGGMFSLDNGRERRFLTRSNICTLPERANGREA